MVESDMMLGHEYPDASTGGTALQQKVASAHNGHQPKIPPRRIPSDECVVRVGAVYENDQLVHPGEPYPVHEGEWVEILPIMTVMEVMALTRLRKGVESDTDFDQAFGDLCKELSLRVVKWNWTDMMNEPMPQPFQRPDVIARLTTDELLWLTNSMYEPTENRKNV
jgi:hypothetical protein